MAKQKQYVFEVRLVADEYDDETHATDTLLEGLTDAEIMANVLFVREEEVDDGEPAVAEAADEEETA